MTNILFSSFIYSHNKVIDLFNKIIMSLEEALDSLAK